MQAYPIYALTNADTLYGVLNGIAALMRSHSFSNAIAIFGLLGFFWAVVLMAMHRNASRVIIYLIGITLFIHFGLRQSVRVQVISQMDGKTYAIEHVPALIAIPASWMSTLGFEGARLVDAAYASTAGMPTALTMTGGQPFSITNQLLQDASTYELQDPYLRSSLIHFMADCGVPMIANGRLPLKVLFGSGNIWSLFSAQAVNPALETVYYGSEAAPIPYGDVLTCPAVYQKIDASFPAAQKQMLAQLSPTLTAGITSELFQSVLQYHVNNTTYSPSAGDYLQQAALIGLLNGSVQRYLVGRSGNSALLHNLAVEQATRATELNWQTTAQVFARTFGYLYTVIQLLVYAVAPILCLLAVFPNGMKTLGKRYVMLLAWFPLTFMMLAITNDLIVSWTHNELGNVFGSFGGLARTSQALITLKAAKLQAVGAYIVSLVPLLSWAILQGGQYAISQIITHSGAQTFGHQAGQVAASGNMSLDNQQYSNTSANKSNFVKQVDIGAVPVTSNISGGSGLNRAHFGGATSSRSGQLDAIQFSQHLQTQASVSGGDSRQTDNGGSLNTGGGFSDQANVNQSVSNATETRIGGGLRLQGLKKESVDAMLKAASGSGIPLNETTANAVAEDLAEGKIASEEAVKAAAKGDTQQATQLKAETQNFYQRAMEKIKNAPWYEKAAAGAIIGAGMVALFGSGVGEAATLGFAAAESSGAALGAAAAEEGLSAEVIAGVNSSAQTVAASGVAAGVGGIASKLSPLKSGAQKIAASGAVSGVLQSLLGGLSGEITESYYGTHGTNLDTGYSAKSHKNAENREGYSNNQRVDQNQQISSSTAYSETYQVPGEAYYRALNIQSSDAISLSPIEKAKQQIEKMNFDMAAASLQVQEKIANEQAAAKTWEGDVRESIKDRGGINQLPRTEQQKKAGDYYVRDE